MSVSKLSKPKWDRKTVVVTGFGKMRDEALELLYENTDKSGGGPVESLTMAEGNTHAFITFMNEAGSVLRSWK